MNILILNREYGPVIKESMMNLCSSKLVEHYLCQKTITDNADSEILVLAYFIANRSASMIAAVIELEILLFVFHFLIYYRINLHARPTEPQVIPYVPECSSGLSAPRPVNISIYISDVELVSVESS